MIERDLGGDSAGGKVSRLYQAHSQAVQPFASMQDRVKMFVPLIFLGLIANAPDQRRGGDRMEAWQATRDGRLLPLREIERRVVPTMQGAQYLGFDFDSSTSIYTLKFLRDGSVIWVDVDGRSGQILGRTGR